MHMATIDIKVPDIGDFAEVAVIEVMVQPGDTIKAEQSLVTVESDKASMEIPSSHAGVVREVRVKLGDKIAEGSVLLTLEVEGRRSGCRCTCACTRSFRAKTGPSACCTSACSYQNRSVQLHRQCRSGVRPARARRRPRRLQRRLPRGRPGPQGGAGRALRPARRRVPERGLHPQQGLLHVAAVMDEVSHLSAAGIDFGAPTVNVDTLRGHKEKVIGKLTGGLAQMAKMRKVTTVRGYGAFVGANHVEVEETTGSGQEKTGTKKVIAFKNAIIAAGSQAVRLPFMPDDPRVVDSTGALALQGVPKRMLILGGGIIGLEMGTVYSTLGARLDVVEMMDGLMQGADRDLVKVWEKMNKHRFDNILLKTKTVGAQATPEGIQVQFEGLDGTKSEGTYDLVLQAVGRTPNGKKIAADKAGVAVTDRGFINVDIQMRTNVPHIFAIGDIVGQPMLAHKAVHEAHVAAEVIAGELQGNKELASAAFNARVIPSVAYTDPEVAWVGLTEDQAKAQGIKVKKGLFPWTASGRAIANGRDEGVTKLLFDDSPEAHGHGKILGGGMVGTHAGDMIGEIALAIEMGADAVDIGKTIHPHPTLGESIGMAAEVAHGSCTDVPPARK
jgi:dihydrolipoamide dehydrogenase